MLRGGALNFSAWCMIGFTSHHVSASSHRSPLCAAQHEQSAAYKTEMHDLLSLKAINPALGEASPIDCRLPFVRFDFRTHFSNFLKTALCIGSGESMTPERKRRTTSKTRRKTKLQNSNAHKEMFPITQQTNEWTLTSGACQPLVPNRWSLPCKRWVTVMDRGRNLSVIGYVGRWSEVRGQGFRVIRSDSDTLL